ncbi:RNA polymerase sigma factor [Nocardioides caldifontis]|uniref:RNA polymerase sigma factor n=1 Tax=Nocardioides caldifontis TaxID=2588938 RepID=UPI001396C80F|nr:SigE family RNA polymerase sigma factor [Nocardioides caldifontis]
MNPWHGAGQERLQLIDTDSAAAQAPAEPPAPEPFDAFYRREYPRLRVLAVALLGTDGADDVVQETMLVAYRRWEDVRDLESPAGWVRGVCSHKAVSTLRRRGVERRALSRLRALPAAEPQGPGGLEDFWASVRRLPARQAQVVCLYYALDLGVAEVASTLGCSEGTVKMHLSRARDGLSRAMGEGDRS